MPTILCLNGGGVRGILQVGALQTMGIDHLHTVFTEGVYGISIGAVICSLIAFRFSVSELVEFSYKLAHFHELLDRPRLDQLFSIQHRLGLDSGEIIHSTLKAIFQRKGLDIDTLKIGDAAIPLCIIASDITYCKPVIFRKDIRVWDAIRASISLPLVFTPHIIKGRVFVDGAVLCSNIVEIVPQQKRSRMIALLLHNNMTLPSIDTMNATTFMNVVFNARTVIEFNKMVEEYPNNVCLLTETVTDLLELNLNVPYLLETGRDLYRRFLTKSTL